MSSPMTISRRAFLGIDRRRGRRDDAAAPRASAAEFEYKMGHSSPESHPFHKRLLEVADRIAKESGGRMTLTIFPNSQLGGDNDLLSQARSGAVEFVPAGRPHPRLGPAGRRVNGMGFAFSDYDAGLAGDRRRSRRLHPRRRSRPRPASSRWSGAGISASARSPQPDKPIKTAADLAGLKLRVPGAPALVVAVQGARRLSGQHAVRRGLHLAADPHRRRRGEPALGHRRRQVLRGAEILRASPTTSGTATGSAPIPTPGTRLPPDLQGIVAKAFNEIALLEREDLAKLDQSLQATLEAKGVTFTEPDIGSFRDKLRERRLLRGMARARSATRRWTLLEKYVGKLA